MKNSPGRNSPARQTGRDARLVKFLFVIVPALMLAGILAAALAALRSGNAELEALRKENDSLRRAYSALELDLGDLRRASLERIEELTRRLIEYAPNSQERGKK